MTYLRCDPKTNARNTHICDDGQQFPSKDNQKQGTGKGEGSNAEASDHGS